MSTDNISCRVMTRMITVYLQRENAWTEVGCQFPGNIPAGLHAIRHGVMEKWLADDDDDIDSDSPHVIVFESHHLFGPCGYFVTRELAQVILQYPKQKVIAEVNKLEAPINIAEVRSAISMMKLHDLIQPYREMLVPTGKLYEWRAPHFRDIFGMDRDFPYLWQGRNFVDGFYNYVDLLSKWLRESPSGIEQMIVVGASGGEVLLVTDQFRHSIAEYESFSEEFWLSQELKL